MFKILCTLVALYVSPCYASTFTATPKRTIYVTGVIAGNAIDIASKIESLSRTSTDEDIDLIINSPGGSIVAGMQILSAMQVAQARGVNIRCFVPMLAASMAFAIYAQCDERYALPYTLLLWHPGKLSSNAPMTEDTTRYSAQRLAAVEKELNTLEFEALGVSKEFFVYHYIHETLWTAKELVMYATKFAEIVDNFEGVENPYTIGE